MKKKVLRLLGLLCAGLMLCGCNRLYQQHPEPMSATVTKGAGAGSTNYASQGTAYEVPEREITNEQTGALARSALAVLNETMTEEEKNKNILISPLSIEMALGMTANGADGETKEEMEQVLSGGLSVEDLNYILLKTKENLEADGDVKWNVANAIWTKDDGRASFQQEFLNRVKTYYGADIYMGPMDDQTVAEINEWVDQNTNHMISEIIKRLPENSRTALVNAVAFEGEWKEKYEDDDIHENSKFTNADGSVSNVNMLYSKENRYFTLGPGEGFVKPYEGEKFSFVGILPEEGTTPEEYIEYLSTGKEDFSEAIRNAEHTEVRVRIPEFTADYDVEMSEIYKNMGMVRAFDSEAGLTKMLMTNDGKDYGVHIGLILHKTHIEVDRKGTKAAAATAVITYDNAVAFDDTKVITLNRPFVYAIVDNETGLPMFLGIQNTME